MNCRLFYCSQVLYIRLMKFISTRNIIIFFILLSFVTRIPLLKSDNMILDLDECVIGMMARHQYEGKDLSLFFWGQKYGFSFVETTAIAISYAIGGVSDDAVKLAMLVLWTIGVIFFYKTLLQVNEKGKLTPFLITLLFILSPAWAVWSMKARGGYLTSFMFTSFVLYLLFHKKYGNRSITYITIGIFLSIIYASQPLWLPGLAPLILYKLLQEKKRRNWLHIGVSSLCCFVIFWLLKHNLPDNHNPKVFWLTDTFSNIGRVPIYLFDNQHGAYFFYFLKAPNNYTSIFAIAFSTVVYLLILAGAYYLVRKKKASFFLFSVLSILLTLFYTLFTFWEEPRYLLPITGYTLLALQLFLNRQNNIKLYQGALLALGIWGAISSYSLRDFSFCKTREKELKGAIQYLLDRNIHHVYCPNWMLQWQIMFYSNEQVIARQQEIPDRCRIYNIAIDKALYTLKPVAMINYDYDYYGIEFPHPPIQIPGYYVYENPTDQFLGKYFILWPKSRYYRL